MRQMAFLLAASGVALLTAACTSGSPAQHPAGKSSAPPAAPSGPAVLASGGQQVPATYRQACANESGVCAGDGPAGRVPAVLNRPLRRPMLQAGKGCPASHGSQLNTAYFGGTVYGNGPVKVLINSPTPHGTAELINPTSEPPWLGIKTTWFSEPTYKGPFLVRAMRLGAPGPAHVVDGSTAAPLVVPPGPTVNGGGGWREAPGGFWVRGPGCYAFQVDGLTFSYDIVVRAVLR